MRTDEFRSALHDHADDVADGGAQARLDGVHGRVVAARRRRKTSAAVVGLMAAAAVTAAVLPPVLRHQPPVPAVAPPKLAGHAVPHTQTLEGQSYHYARGVQTTPGSRLLRLRLPEAQADRSLAWMSSGREHGVATLKVDGTPVDRARIGALRGQLPLLSGVPHLVTISLHAANPGGRLGLAIYDKSPAPPAGVSNGTETYRRTIAADRLLGATFSRPGDRSVSLQFTLPSGAIRISGACYGAGRHVEVRTEVNGHPATGTGCARSPYPLPGGDGITFEPGDPYWKDLGVEPGDKVRLTERVHGSGHIDGAVMGLGVYQLGPVATRVAGSNIPEYVSLDGRLWRFDHAVEGRVGQTSVTAHLRSSSAARLLEFAADTSQHSMVRTLHDGERGDQSDGGVISGSDYIALPLRAHTERVVASRTNGHARLAILVYRQVPSR